MLAELRRALPTVRALSGSAEAIPLSDGSVDAVLAGNAMHWFDMAVAGPEIARVLAPQGLLAGLWNLMDDRVPWVAELARVSGSAAIGPRDTPESWRAETVLVMPEQEQEATLGRLRAFLGSRPETTCGEFTLPTLTGALRVRSL